MWGDETQNCGDSDDINLLTPPHPYKKQFFATFSKVFKNTIFTQFLGQTIRLTISENCEKTLHMTCFKSTWYTKLIFPLVLLHSLVEQRESYVAGFMTLKRNLVHWPLFTLEIGIMYFISITCRLYRQRTNLGKASLMKRKTPTLLVEPTKFSLDPSF